MTNIHQIRKAIVPLVIMGVMAGLSSLGISGGMSVSDAVTLLITSLGVWAIPNKK